MPNWLIAWILGIAIGLIVGRWVARDSEKKQPVLGGTAARVLHYLACSFIVSGAPTALLTVIIVGGSMKFFPRLLLAVGLVFFNLLVGALCLIGYAALQPRKGQPSST